IVYMTATILECLFIVMNGFNHPISHAPSILQMYLPFPTRASKPHMSYTAAFGLLLFVTGGFLRISSFKALGSSFTFNVTQSSPKLVTSGPYSLVRHPSYLGGCLMTTGLAVYHLSPGTWLRESGVLQYSAWRAVVGLWVFFVVVVTNACMVMRSPEEDRLMKKMFGDEWEEWRKVVRYKVFPGLY
ncbi:hypothetical protein L218DRAFT_879163, partial [Marasmius fiardii PR-910]